MYQLEQYPNPALLARQGREVQIAAAVGAGLVAGLALAAGVSRIVNKGLSPVTVINVQPAAANARYKDNGNLKRQTFHDWEKITGITLHQVGVPTVGRTAYPKMTAHLGVHHDGTIYWIHPFNTYLHHAGLLSKDTVSIEVAGLFGVDDPLPEAQANGLRQAIWLIQRVVAEQGGRIETIYGHRQSSSGRLGDPNRAIWQAGALWAEKKLGIPTDPYHTRYTGEPIPATWDPRLAVA